jgi:hypothetical protein
MERIPLYPYRFVLRPGFLRIAAGVCAVAAVCALGREPVLEFAHAQSFAAVFQLNDGPGPWFRCSAGSGCVQAGTQSLAIVSPGSVVRFIGGSETETVHTTTSLLWPLTSAGDDADNMPFDQAAAFRGAQSVTLNTPGLYVFVCKLHPFMLAAVIVDDGNTEGLDLGEQIRLVNGLTVPTLSDLGVAAVERSGSSPTRRTIRTTIPPPTRGWHGTSTCRQSRCA